MRAYVRDKRRNPQFIIPNIGRRFALLCPNLVSAPRHTKARSDAVMQRNMTQPVKLLPNWALAGLLSGFIAGSYYYTLRRVGNSDLEAEVQREVKRQRKELEAAQAN
jgi:hypothetical protein